MVQPSQTNTMLNLKNMLRRGLNRLPASAKTPWKVAAYVIVLLLPGGSLLLLALLWLEQWRARRRSSLLTMPLQTHAKQDPLIGRPCSTCCM